MAKANFTARNKTVSIPLEGGGIYVGRVAKKTGAQVFVEVPSLSPKFAFGPCLVSGTIAALEVNDRVICAFLNNSTSELIVLGKIFTGTISALVIDGGSA